MLGVTLVGDKELVQKFDKMPLTIDKEVTKEMSGFVEDFRTYVITQKLSGQVLNHITGKLWRSIQSLLEKAATTITGKVYASADCPYAAIHEYGGVIHMPARTQTVYRKLNRSGELMRGFVKKKSSNFATDHAVSGHDIHMPERSYLRSSQADKKQEFSDRMQQAYSRGSKII